MKSNFNFPTNDAVPQFAQIGATVENYVSSGHNTYIYQLRMFAECLAQKILAFEPIVKSTAGNTYLGADSKLKERRSSP